MKWKALAWIGGGLSCLALVAFPLVPNPWVAISSLALCLAATTLCAGLARQSSR